MDEIDKKEESAEKAGEALIERRQSNRGRSNRMAYVLAALSCVAVLLLGAYVVLFLGKSSQGEVGQEPADEAADLSLSYTQEEVDRLVDEARAEEAGRILDGIKQSLERGEAMASALRPYYPDDVVVYTDGRVRFFPIQEDLKKNSYLQENLVELEGGVLQYVEGGQVLSHKGIDVSHHQGQIDWGQVAEDGVEFAFIRVGLRGYGTGKVVLDERFEENIKGALGNGIQVGVYFYSQSINQEEVLEEASLVLEQIAPYKVTGPVVYDSEKVADSRTSPLSAQERTDMALAFCKAVEDAGYRPMIYLNMNAAFSIYDLAKLEAYDKWFAHYTHEIYYPYAFNIWQYSDHGKVQGIEGEVDLNLSFEDWTK